MSKAPKDLRIPIMMSSAEVEAIDNWRFANKIATRAEAVRRLCQVSLTVLEGSTALAEVRRLLVASLREVTEYVGDMQNDLNDQHDFYMRLIEAVGDGAIEIGNVNRAIGLVSPDIPVSETAERSEFLRNIANEARERIENAKKKRKVKSRSS